MPTPRLSDDNEADLAYYRMLRRGRQITAAQYAREKRRIINKQLRENDAADELARQRRLEQREREKRAAREAATLAKRTFVMTQNYGKETLVWRPKTGMYERISLSELDDFTMTQTLIRRTGERRRDFDKRARQVARELLEKKMAEFEEAGSTLTVIKPGAFSLHQPEPARQGMTRVKPWAYENSDFYSLVDEGRCVPRTLHQLYPKYSYDRIVASLFPDGDDDKPCLAEWVLNFCVKKDITCLGCDENYDILVGEETGVPIEYYSANRHHAPLYFVQKDNHMYIMDRKKGLELANSRKNSRKVVKETVAVPRTIVYCEDDVEIDFTVENTEYVLSSRRVLREHHGEYLRRYHSIPKHEFGISGKNAISLKSFSWGKNNKARFEPHYKLVRFLAQKLGCSDSVKSISDRYLEQCLGDIPRSFLNDEVMNCFLTWPQRQHFAHRYTLEVWRNNFLPRRTEQSIDMNKQYTSILWNPPHPWLVMDMLSIPQPYSGLIGDAMYFVVTTNMMPAKGNGWYSRVLVEYLIAKNIPHEILYEIRPAKVLPTNYFTAFVDTVMKDVPDAFKHITNTACGSLNIHAKKRAVVRSTLVKAEALEPCFTQGALLISFPAGDETIYANAKIHSELIYENNMPMYSQILDTAAVLLATKIAELEDMGCKIRSYNTDSITFAHTSVYELPPNQQALGGWKTEEVKEYTGMCQFKPNNQMYYPPTYEFQEDVTDKEVDVLAWLKGKSAFVSAPAGYGKTWWVQKFVETVGVDDCCILAYTNMAACNIGGTTLHKTFQINLDEYKGARSLASVMGDKQYLIVEEISQLPVAMYKLLEEASRAGKYILALGDLKQILPVGETRDCLPLLTRLCKNRLTLTTYRRGDMELLESLNCVRNRESVPFDNVEKGQLYFCSTKAMRNLLNEREISKVKKGYWDLPANDNLRRIFVGMPLRSTRTARDKTMMNGERWVIQKITQEWVVVSSLIREMVLEIPFHEIHRDFVPGFAMTIHSSQGLTISEPYTVYLDPSKFCADDIWRMLYTATSRARTKSQVGVVYQ
jgi:hypothetical protein